MNVLRAVQIFSEPVTAALRTFLRLGMCDKEDEGDLEATIYFMEMIRTWFQIHDVHNKTYGYHLRNENKIPFVNINDERLDWLVYEFLPYIEVIQVNATRKEDRLTDETFGALNLTTRSTVALVKYLLDRGFHYVFTRKFSSDAIVQTFSHLRHSGGFIDQMDVRSCILSLEHTLKIGILKSSTSSNCSTDSKSKPQVLNDNGTDVCHPSAKEIVTKVTIPGSLMLMLEIMERLSLQDNSSVSIKTLSIAVIGGYILKIAEENTECWDCLEKLINPTTNSPIYALIKEQDRGGLKYPSRLFQ